MKERSLHQDWITVLSKCVYVKFHQINFSTSQDMAKKQIFFSKIGRLIRREGWDLERELSKGEKYLIAN